MSTALPKDEKVPRGSRKKGSRRIDGSRQFWVSVCWWEGRNRGVAYAQNGELMDALKEAAPSTQERKDGMLGKYTIVTPTGKTTNLLSDMMFSDIAYLEALMDAWHEVWLTVRPGEPTEAEDAEEGSTSDVEDDSSKKDELAKVLAELSSMQQRIGELTADLKK